MPAKDLLERVKRETAKVVVTSHDCIRMDNRWYSQNSTNVQRVWQEIMAG